jgi:hypothetical protein
MAFSALSETLSTLPPNFGKKEDTHSRFNICMNADGPPVLLKKCMGVVAVKGTCVNVNTGIIRHAVFPTC